LQPAKQIIGGLNISTHENRGHHTDDAFAPFVHLDILTCSSFVRLSTAAGSDLPVSNRCRLGETSFTFASSWSSFCATAAAGVRGWLRGAPEWRALSLGILLALLAIAVHGMVDTPYFKNDLSLEFWGLAALATTAWRASAPGGA